MKRFKQSLIAVLIVVTIVLMPLFSGCETSAERIAQVESAISAARNVSASADKYIAMLAASTPALEQSLADGNLPSELRQKTLAALNTTRTKLQSLQQAKIKADNALAQYQATLQQIKADANNVTWATEAQAYGEGAKVIAPMLPPPYNGYVYLGGWILSLIGGAFAAKKKVDASKAEKALDEVVTGNEIFLQTAPDDAASSFKAAQNQVQTAATIQKVAAIKAS